MTELTLTGIDGSNPLGFLAALGVLRILSDAGPSDAPPRMFWAEQGTWRPTLSGVGSIEAIVDAVLTDLKGIKGEPAFELAYSKEADGGGSRLDPNAKDAIRDLKPPLRVQSELYAEAVQRYLDGQPRTARMVAAFGTEVATDNAGFAKPTALHFTAGQQQFLAMTATIAAHLDADDVFEALVGPWRYESKLPSFSWTGTGQRLWAYRASNPAGEKRGSCAGAEWLALQGLSFFPCAPAATRRGPVTRTAGIRGGWKDGSFTWPLWTAAATARAVASLLTHPSLDALSTSERRARGIGIVQRADILRSDQGGYGSFSPPRVV